MTARRPAPQSIEGRFIRLEPLTVNVLPALHAAIGKPEVYAQGYNGGPKGYGAPVRYREPDAGTPAGRD